MFERLSGGAGNVLGFRINDQITGEDVQRMSGIMAAAIAASGKIRLLIEIEGFRHMEIQALLEKLKFARNHAGEIERMAVLSDRVWIKSWLKVGGLLTHTEVEHFDRADIESAWKWLEHV
jgi:hypothetical protein